MLRTLLHLALPVLAVVAVTGGVCGTWAAYARTLRGERGTRPPVSYPCRAARPAGRPGLPRVPCAGATGHSGLHHDADGLRWVDREAELRQALRACATGSRLADAPRGAAPDPMITSRSRADPDLAP